MYKQTLPIYAITIENELECEQVQILLFSMGYDWPAKRKIPSMLTTLYLFLNYSEDYRIQQTSSEQTFFDFVNRNDMIIGNRYRRKVIHIKGEDLLSGKSQIG